MSQHFFNYLMHSTQQYSDIYNFTFTTRDSIQEHAKVIEIDCSNTSYLVDNKMLDKIKVELLNIYTQEAGFPKNEINVGLNYGKKMITFQFKQFSKFN